MFRVSSLLPKLDLKVRVQVKILITSDSQFFLVKKALLKFYDLSRNLP